MQLWRRKAEEPEISRAELILARKPDRDRHAPRGAGLLQIRIPREQSRRTHERGEDRRVLEGVSAEALRGGRRVPVGVVNLSSGGVMIDTGMKLAIGDTLPIALEGCDAVPLIVRWIRGRRVGLEFLAETTIVAQAGVQDYIIDTIRREAAGNTLRSDAAAGAEARDAGPRHALMWLCEVAASAGVVATRLRNISRSGAMVSFDEDTRPLHAGEDVVLAMGEDAQFDARVMWVGAGLAGLRFSADFPVEELIARPCAEIVPDAGDAPAAATYASREEAMRIEYMGLKNPYDAPDMDYQPLTIRELYETLYRAKE